MIPLPATLTTFAARIGVSGAIMAALGTGLVVQTIRLEGAQLWPFGIEGAKPKAERMERERDAAKDATKALEREYKAAQAEAAQRAVAARVAAQERYAAIARNADNELNEARRDALADARDFIERNRVRTVARSASSGPTATAHDSDSGVPVPTDTASELDGAEYVIVPASDVLICTTNTVDIEAAKEWAGSLGEVAE